jgi:hypothetical protein
MLSTMTGNTFHPDAVARAIELILAGETQLTRAIRREFTGLTAAGIARVISIAGEEIEENQQRRS